MADVLKPTPPGEKTKEKKPEDKNEKSKEEELSDEDKQLQEELDMLVERLKEQNEELHLPALESLKSLIKASTTSMTSVPKPLKFMRKHFTTMKNIHSAIWQEDTQKFCADVISVLAMTIGEGRECLHFKLRGRLDMDIGEWGHEYVRHLSGEIAQEWWVTNITPELRDSLLNLSKLIIPYNLKHNAEAEACDLAMELEHLELLEKFVDDDTHYRVCSYLTSCVSYVPDPENVKLLKCALNIYRKFGQWPQALRIALQLNDTEIAAGIVQDCPDDHVRKQLAFMIGRQQIHVDIELKSSSTSDVSRLQGEINDIMTNSLLNTNFLALGRELDILEPKTPDEVYKSHLDGGRQSFGSQVDSARQNLASSFVSGFVNAGFGRDKLLTEDGNKWLYKNKEHGMLSATASLGLILLWDVDGGLGQIDKYLYSAEEYIKAGALLACGIVNCGVRNDCDPALALLSDYVVHQSSTMKIGAILGLGLAYAGTDRADIIELLTPTLTNPHSGPEIIGLSGLACGLVSVGTCNIDVTALLLQCLMERNDSELKEFYIRYIALGLGLCYLGKQEAAETVFLALEVIPHPYRAMATTLVEVCAYAGTGNVLKIQKLLHICSEHYENSDSKKDRDDESRKTASRTSTMAGAFKSALKKPPSESTISATTTPSGKSSSTSVLNGSSSTTLGSGSSTTIGSTESGDKKDPMQMDLSSQQSIATLGIALISMGEDIGAEMAFRTFGHLLRYCEPIIRRAVPLALGLLSVSNPRLSVLDTLSKFSHDADQEVALNSIFAMGLVGAGTNNARVAAMLRQLSQYHAKDSNNLFMVRIAQGLVHLGKGTLGLTPFHSDRTLLCPVALGGLLATVFTFLDVKGMILGRGHYMLYCLATAMNPRMLATFDENLKPLPVSVRVGQALDTVGVAGKPKTITGFQTYTTPVLLGHGERAELATDDYVSLSPILEGFVILRKNPDAM